MALKDILVHLDSTHHSSARLELAVKLADKHQARLTALYVVTHAFYDSSPSDAKLQSTALEAEFHAKCGAAGLTGTWCFHDWNVTGVSVSEVVNMNAYYADLVIVGQTDDSYQERGIQGDLPERVVMGAGRPVLIVPYTGSFKEFGSRVLVAWKSGRESTRAANDALPILQKAGSVSVLEVNPTDLDKGSIEKIADHLACHDVTVKTEHLATSGISIADVLLNRVSTEGSDLLVMGAYAHTTFGTLALGKAARHILRHMTVPVLMSH